MNWDWLWALSWFAAILTVPSVLLQREGRPLAALSWLFALFALPMVTLLAWWLFGRTHLRRKRRRRRAASEEIGEKLTAWHSGPARASSASLGPLSTGALPPTLREAVAAPVGGNRVDLLPSPSLAYAEWLKRIDGAEHHVHATFYAWHDDAIGRQFRDQLGSRAEQGIEVRLMIDGVGSARLPRRFFDPLRRAGGQVEVFMQPRILARNPMLNFRNHRKLLIVDGRYGYTGGINIGEAFARWEDVAVAVQGPAIRQLQQVFVDDWYFCTDEEILGPAFFDRSEVIGASEYAVVSTVASGPDQRWNAVREMLYLVINQSKKRVWLMTPYLIPDESLLIALRTAVYRGVDVKVLVPATSDSWIVPMASRTFYPEILRAGIALFEHPAFVHTKLALFDEDLSLVGSANLDVRSFRLNFEVSSLVASGTLNANVERYFDDRIALSEQVTSSGLRSRSHGGRLMDAAAHLLSPLL